MPEADGEIASQESLWSQLSDCLGAQMGLHYPKERWGDLKRGIVAAARAFGMASPEACARRLVSTPLTRHQIEVLAGCLTIGETYFFREKRSFEILEEQVLPELLRTRSGGERRLRIWSAGCCTGEEPYSVAILLAKTIPDLQNWNISILATDIDPDFLRKASLGIYGEWSFRDAPPGIKERFFRKTKQGRFEIVPRIKALVNFSYLNLAADSYPSLENGTNAMDVILCRNVLMYFEPARAREVLQKLRRSLLEGGWLFVSPVEVPQASLPELARLDFQGAIVHRRGSISATAERPAAPVACDLHVDEKPASPTPGLPPQPAEPPAQTPHEQAAAMALLARACANQGLLAEALRWCEKALEADKLNAAWCYLRATILQEQGLAEDAAAALKRAIYLDQDNALAHFALGNLMRRQGRRNEAGRHFRNALAILSACRPEQVLPESEGITAGRLAEVIRSTVSSEARA